MTLLRMFYIFTIYSVIGFVAETLYTSLLEKRFMHRGFLFGPYIPIYGFGAALITYFIQGFQGNPIGIFILSMIICSILEYITSWILEKLFHARWWDYSKQWMNIHGRICIKNSSLFGIGGVLIIDVINVRVMNLSVMENMGFVKWLCGILFLIISVDFIVSMIVMWDIKQMIDLTVGDNTETIKEQKIEYMRDYFEELSEEIKNELIRKSVMHRRIINAFQIKIRHKL